MLSPGVNPGVAGFEDEELSSLPSSDEPRLASYTAPMIETQEKLSPAWIDKMARDQEQLRKGEYEGHVRDVPKWALTQVALIVRDAIHGRQAELLAGRVRREHQVAALSDLCATLGEGAGGAAMSRGC